VAYQPVIAVIGEALIDLVVDGDSATARVGGAGFNTATAIGRLGVAPVFLDGLSSDGFGRMLRTALERDGVLLGLPDPVSAPTTLAIADIDPSGDAHYSFYLEGTSAAAVGSDMLATALPEDVAAVHAGALALVMEPIGSAIERLLCDGIPPGTLVMVDPNCRPPAITDRDAYLARLTRILRRADVVKASTEDLGYLFPGISAETAAHELLGKGPALVLVTDGPRPIRAFLPGQVLTAEVPRVRVADTIGAGDVFGGSFLALWAAEGYTRHDLGRIPEVRAALRTAAGAVAVFLSEKPGRDGPVRA
jgi:fructokinase